MYKNRLNTSLDFLKEQSSCFLKMLKKYTKMLKKYTKTLKKYTKMLKKYTKMIKRSEN